MIFNITSAGAVAASRVRSRQALPTATVTSSGTTTPVRSRVAIAARRISLCIVWLTACGLPVQAGQLEFFTYGQLTAESTEAQDAIGFGADMVRVGFRVREDRFTARLQLDLNAGDLSERPPGTLPNVIKDFDVAIALDERHSLRFGQFKAPLGYDFLLPGSALDVAKRGMEKGLVLERSIGLMLSGRKLAGVFGYDLGLFNPAGRSAATRHTGSGPLDQTGENFAAAARVTFDPDERWHAEAAFGVSQDAGGPGTETYRVTDLAVVWRQAPWTLKAEYIDGRDVRGTRGRDERVWYLHAGHALSEKLSAVVRHYDGESTTDGGTTSLANTYLGLAWFLDESNRANSRLMLNYVRAGGDEERYTGVRGFRGDALFAQFQFHYSR